MEAETERYMSDINNSVYDSIYKRRSIRKYKSDMLPKEQIEKILDAARVATVRQNRQPWKFFVYGGEEKEKILSEMRKRNKEGIKRAVI